MRFTLEMSAKPLGLSCSYDMTAQEISAVGRRSGHHPEPDRRRPDPAARSGAWVEVPVRASRGAVR